MKSNLLVRLLSGLVYIAVIVAACLLPASYGVICLAFLFGITAVIELKSIFGKVCGSPVWSVVLDLAIVCSMIIPSFSWLLAFLLLLVRMIMMVFDTHERPVWRFMCDLMTVFYIGVPMLSMVLISETSYSSGLTVLAVFIMIWLNDTGAYCIGSLFGKHKMYPRVSPKKSWEGLAGGLLFCVAFGILLGFTNFGMGNVFPMYSRQLFWIVGSVIVCVGSTFGDLFESVIKRNINVKDSGHLIPGHGGILDRIDSSLLVLPLFLLWIFVLDI